MVSDIHEVGELITDDSLNPCSNGIWSLTYYARARTRAGGSVLILVLMEYGL